MFTVHLRSNLNHFCSCILKKKTSVFTYGKCTKHSLHLLLQTLHNRYIDQNLSIHSFFDNLLNCDSVKTN